MRVDEWHDQFLKPYLQQRADASQRDRIQEVLYLTDISLPHLSHRQLRRAIPILAECDETGRLTLNSFVHAAHGPHIAIPDVQALLYLNPPTDGWILTPTHYDGHGTQTSLHAVLFGGASQHNLVYTFPVQYRRSKRACDPCRVVLWMLICRAVFCGCQGERSSAQERQFRQAVGIARLGVKQVTMHDTRSASIRSRHPDSKACSLTLRGSVYSLLSC